MSLDDTPNTNPIKDEQRPTGSESETTPVDSRDYRVYLPYPDGWDVHLKNGWDKLYCYAKMPGEDFFHLIQHGELYLQVGEEKFCLTCAVRRGILTTERLFWQHRRIAPSKPFV